MPDVLWNPKQNMANDFIAIREPNYYPNIYRFKRFLKDIDSIIQVTNEVVTYIASYQANIYVGTSLGQILHYHRFEDVSEYMIISQIQISQDKSPIKKILILPQIERALVLCGDIASVYTIPELSPSHIGKLKKIVNLLYLSSQVKNSEIQPNEQVLVLTNDKIRVIQICQELIKLLKDISYSNAINCAAFSYSNSANNDSLIVVANKTNYDIIDLKQTRKVPLFDYNAEIDSNTFPQIVPFCPNDNENNQEFLLTVKSDESTSMSMFIDSSGDITRGTLLWPNKEYPSGAIVNWPYVFAICEETTNETKLVISSLESLEVQFTSDLRDILDFNEREKDKKETKKEEDIASNMKISEGGIKECKAESEPKNLDVGDSKSATSRVLIQDSRKFKILQVYENIEFLDDELSNLLCKTNVEDGSSARSTSRYNVSSPTLIYKNCDIWLIHKENELITLTKKLQEILQSSSILKGEIQKIIEKIEITIDQSIGELRIYSIWLLFLLYILTNELIKGMSIAFKKLENTSNDISNLALDPRYLILAIDKIHPDNPLFSGFQIFTVLYDVSKSLIHKTNTQKKFLIEYIEKLYTTIICDVDNFNNEILIYCRMKLYQEKLTSSSLIIKFVNILDKNIWLDHDFNNNELLKLMRNRNNYFGLLHVYLLVIGQLNGSCKVETSKDICDLSLKLLGHELSDPDIKEPMNSEIKVNDSSFDLLQIILTQLKEVLSNEKVYSMYLLEILKINPSAGISFMKLNNTNQKETHKHIMKEMSDSCSGEVDFSHLRLEYMESNFLESIDESLDFPALDELLVELAKDIVSNVNESNNLNFEALQEAYRIENTLDDSNWPKISWPDYLRICLKQSECQRFIELYLKILELLIFRSQNVDSQYGQVITKFESIFSDKNIFEYYKLVYDEKRDTLLGLLEFSDFSSAEYFALYEAFPLPAETFYFNKIDSFSEPSYISKKSKLSFVFEFYLHKRNKDLKNFRVIKHFISTYSNFFTFHEMLEILPVYLPIIYLEDYLKDVLINLNLDHRDVILKKVLGKVDAKSTKDLCEDLTTGSDL